MRDERDFKIFKSTHHNGTDIAKILKKTSPASQKRDTNSRQIYERLIEKC